MPVSAKRNVPTIKPNCTADVMLAIESAGKENSADILGRIALPANHKDVPANCANMMMGRVRLGLIDFIISYLTQT